MQTVDRWIQCKSRTWSFWMFKKVSISPSQNSTWKLLDFLLNALSLSKKKTMTKKSSFNREFVQCLCPTNHKSDRTCKEHFPARDWRGTGAVGDPKSRPGARRLRPSQNNCHRHTHGKTVRHRQPHRQAALGQVLAEFCGFQWGNRLAIAASARLKILPTAGPVYGTWQAKGIEKCFSGKKN